MTSNAMDRLILETACKIVEADPEQVMSYRIYNDHVALVVNRGGAGCPKYKVSMDEIDRQKVVISSEPPAEPAPKLRNKTRSKKSGGD